MTTCCIDHEVKQAPCNGDPRLDCPLANYTFDPKRDDTNPIDLIARERRNLGICYIDHAILPKGPCNGTPRLDCPVGATQIGAKKDDTNPKDLLGIKKPPLELIPPTALVAEAIVFKLGAKKYGAYNWRSKKVRAMVYLGATLRHVASLIDREDIDDESRQSHAAHARACLGIYIDALETGNLVDDRPPKGAAGRMIVENTEK